MNDLNVYLCLICLAPWIVSVLVGVPLLAWLHHRGELIGDAPKGAD